MSCRQHLDSLDALLLKVMPLNTDTTFDRSVKAVQSLRYEKDIETLMKRLMEHLTVLLLSGSAPSQEPGSVSLQKPVNNLRYPRDKQYLNRPRVWESLINAMKSSNRAVLTGLGGVGKSQLAIEYCYQFQEKRPEAHILWQHVSNNERILNGWSQMARDLAIPNHDRPDANVFALVSDHLSADECNAWLLVLDNADDETVIFGPSTYQPLAGYLPRHKRGQILITTRNRKVGQKLVPQDAIINVPLLDLEEGLTLLQRKTSQTAWDKPAAEKLVSRLDLIALAISHAGAYIAQNGISISEYIDLLDENDLEARELLREEHYDTRRDQDIQLPILSTWKLSFDIVKQQKPLAIEVLSIMAVMERQGIPSSIIRTKTTSKVQFVSAIGILQAFSLIVECSEAGYFNMHRLVQLSMQDELHRMGELPRYQIAAMEILVQASPEEAFYTDWSQWHSLAPHIEALLQTDIENRQAKCLQIQLLPRIALFYRERGHYQEAHQKLIKLHKLTQQEYGEKSTEMLNSISHLAQLKGKMSRFGESEDLHRKVYQGRTGLLGADNLATMESLGDIAGAQWWQGKYSKAKEIFEPLLQRITLVAGARSTETVKVMLALGATYEKLGKLVDAERLIRDALVVNTDIHGEAHLKTIESTRSLASVLQEQNKHEQAETLFRDMWKSNIATFGQDHPESLKIQELVAGSLYWQQKFVQAEVLQREVWANRLQVLPIHHPLTLESMQALAAIIQKIPRYEESRFLLQQLVEQRTMILGEDHFDTLRSRNDLAFNLYLEGNKSQAARMHETIYHARLRTLGEQHLHTLASLEYVAASRWEQGQRAESIEMHERVLDVRRRVQGQGHPDTLATMDTVIGQLWGEGDLPGATSILRESLAAREALEGQDSPKILEHMCRLAYLIRIQGQKDDAIALYSRALKISEDHFGCEHEETKTIAQNIPDTLAEKLAEAVAA